MRCFRKPLALSSRSPRVAWVGLLATLALSCSTASRSSGAGILEYVPEDALGFVMVNDLNSASTKVQGLAKSVGALVPVPLDYLKFATGFTHGLDEDGDLLLALIPGSRINDPPEPMALIPTDDYAKLARSVGGDASGGICDVTVAGEEVLLSKMGDYALLMNKEHRGTLEIILGLEPEPVEFLSPWEKWLKGNDVSVVLMPEGKKWLVERGSEYLELQIEGVELHMGGLPPDTMGQLTAWMKLYRKMLGMIGDEFQAGALGLAIDDESNILLGKRILLESDYSAGPAETVIRPLSGFADEPFVFAGGCSFPEGLLQAVKRASIQGMRSVPELWQLEELPEEQWNEFEKSALEAVAPIRFSSCVIGVGEAGEAAISNIYSVLEVDDTERMIEKIRQQTKVWNETMQQTKSDIKLNFDMAEKEIANCLALELSLDVVAAANAGDVPSFSFMMESLLGEGSTLRIVYVCVDENLMLTAISDQQGIQQAIDRLKNRENGLEQSRLVAATAKLMPADAEGKFYISPQGLGRWITRVQNAATPPGGGNPTPVELPKTPPIGIALRFPEKQLSVDVVWPAAITKALVKQFGPIQIQQEEEDLDPFGQF